MPEQSQMPWLHADEPPLQHVLVVRNGDLCQKHGGQSDAVLAVWRDHKVVATLTNRNTDVTVTSSSVAESWLGTAHWMRHAQRTGFGRLQNPSAGLEGSKEVATSRLRRPISTRDPCMACVTGAGESTGGGLSPPIAVPCQPEQAKTRQLVIPRT